MSEKNFFTCGPFLKAVRNIDGIATNMYYCSAFEEAWNKMIELEKEYEMLILTDADSKRITEAKDTIEIYKAIIIKSSWNSFNEGESYD